jgi:hypothetical protein
LKTIEILESEKEKKRVRVVEREDGAFVLIPEYWKDEYWEEKLIWSGWLPIPVHASFYQSAEIAKREAQTRFSWLSKS